MKNILSKRLFSILIILLIILIDQIIKIVVKTNMCYGESVHVTNWFYISFVENPGMAFGLQIIPKILQTFFRIMLSCAFIWYISIIVKANYKYGYIACTSLIFAGAVGNIIDSIFYGVIFNQSSQYEISTFVPIGNGYQDWFYGKVVDMFYLPMVEFNWPNWTPIIGGDKFVFFSPVFNFADASISCGIILLIAFYSKSFSHSFELVKEKIANYSGPLKLK
ncbi:lipoprotein signal peptidase [Bacteroides ihuae]|uniref:lipoprotein signal peptidase n=1 Tax=Bacteroides ihuae TaxID=1852362 RepID=UPI0008DB1175|nr:lipoprotein signal peptidase [Bacteroides ihuae]